MVKDKRGMRRLTRGVLIGAALACGVVPATMTTLYAQGTNEKRYSFELPAQPLRRAVAAFARAADVDIAADGTIAEAAITSVVSGNLTLDEGLSRLLAGTGYGYRITGERSVVLFDRDRASALDQSGADALSLGTITVQSENAWGAVDGIIAQRTATGTKTDTPITEIPQAVNVVTADEVTMRGAKSVAQALRYTPGVNVSGYTESYMIADEAVSRGFSPTSSALDGAILPYPGSLGGAYQVDPYLLERIEVLKGPSSVLFGQNEPGGIINMVTKRPEQTPAHEVKLGYNNYGRVEAAMDFTGPLGNGKDLSYRIIALTGGGNEQIDFTNRRRVLLAPSLNWTPTDRTSVLVNLQYQRDNDISDYQALPYIGTVVPGSDGQYISRDLFLGEPNWNKYHRTQKSIGTELTHAFSDNLRLRSTFRYADVDDRYRGMYAWAFVSTPTGTDYSRVTRAKIDWKQKTSTLALDNNLTYEFATGGVGHTLLAGIDYRDTNLKFESSNGSAAVNLPVDLYNPDYGLVSPDTIPAQKYHNTIRQTGVYLQDQMKWDNFTLTLGGRYDWVRTSNRNFAVSPGGTGSEAAQNDSAFTGRVGLTYQFESGPAIYASYSESFVPQVGTDYYGRSFSPTKGKGYEIGVKYQPDNMNALFTAAVFDITKTNMLMTDYEHAGEGSWSVQTGEVRSRGIELEAKAELQEGWNVIAAVSYVDAEYVQDDWYAGNKMVLHSPWTASLWGSYAMQNGVEVGAGIRWSGRKFANNANTLETPSYYVVDMSASYDFSRISNRYAGLIGSLNVTNLFDREYVSRCNYDFGCYYGKARTVNASLTYKW